SFYSLRSGGDFGGIYFGQGDGVLRHKTWSSAQSKTAAGITAGEYQPLSDPNQALSEYLGKAVEPPANLDPRYTRDGLSNAMVSAPEKANVPARVEIDDSEFPFLVGVLCSRPSYTRLMEELKKMDGYADQGSVGNET